MPLTKTNYQDVQSLYELCTNGQDLKEFCHDSGVNYNKFVAWQRKQLWNERLGTTAEPNPPVMSAISITDAPDADVSLSEAVKPACCPIRFFQVEMGDGFFIQKYDTSVEEVFNLLTKLSSLSC